MASCGAPQTGNPLLRAAASMLSPCAPSPLGHPPSPTGYHTHVTQCSNALTGALSPRTEHRQIQVSSLRGSTLDVLMEEDDAERHANASLSAPPRKARYDKPSNPGDLKTFPYRLYRVLEDEEMSEVIVWYQAGEKHGIFIPDLEIFVIYVFPKYFPNMKEWGSFHKQLTNYGFVKDDWNPTQGIFIHSKNMFRQNRRDLLCYVRPKRPSETAPTTQEGVEEQPAPAPNPSAAPNNFPQVVAPRNDSALIDWLIQEVASLKTSQSELKAENGELRTENRELRRRVSKLEDSLAHRHPVMDNRVADVGTQHSMMSRQQDLVSFGDGSLHPILQPGSTVAALNNNTQITGPSDSGDVHLLLPPASHTVPSEGGSVPEVPYGHTTINPAFLSQKAPHPQHPQLRSSAPPTHVRFPVAYTRAQPTHEGPPLVLYSADEPAGLKHPFPQISDPTAGAPPPVRYDPGGPNSVQALGSPRPLGRRMGATMAQVPQACVGPDNPDPSSSSTQMEPSGSPSFLETLFSGTLSFPYRPRG